MRLRTIARSLALLVLTAAVAATTALAAPGKFHSLSPHLKDAVDLGRAPASERHRVVVSLDVRDREGLEAFLADVQDPSSPRYRQFLSQAEFDALYAPTEAQEQAVVDPLRGAAPSASRSTASSAAASGTTRRSTSRRSPPRWRATWWVSSGSTT